MMGTHLQTVLLIAHALVLPNIHDIAFGAAEVAAVGDLEHRDAQRLLHHVAPQVDGFVDILGREVEHDRSRGLKHECSLARHDLLGQRNNVDIAVGGYQLSARNERQHAPSGADGHYFCDIHRFMTI